MDGRAAIGGLPAEGSAPVASRVGPGKASAFDLLLGLATALLLGLTVVALLPGVRPVVSNSTLDVVLNTLTAIAAAGAAALAWIRYRIEHDVAAIFESSAFLVLCMTRLLIVGIASIGQAEALGMSLDAPQQWPLYAWSLARLVSAVLLAVAANRALRTGSARRPSPWLVVLGPVVGLLFGFVALRSIEPDLPPLMGGSALAALAGTGGSAGMEPLGLAFQAVVGAIYVWGALEYRRIFRERGQRYAGYLAVALVVAAVSQVHWATYPGIYRPLVGVDDLLRALFSVILLLGIESQFRADFRDLRLANARLRALQAADAERLALEASARLARDVHDGLSQDLWLAKLKQARLADAPSLPEPARQLVTELGEAMDRALADARSIVSAMREGPVDRSLVDSLRRAAEDFERETGIRAAVTIEPPLPAVPPEVAGEVVRIVREALTNVRRHADATTVRVAARELGSRESEHGLEVSVVDNGRGFDPMDLPGTTYGILGMSERAQLVGGSLEVATRRADGTTIRVTVPVRHEATTASEVEG